ncbi:MAG: ribonuclease H-like domain-containing protein [Thermomicrobiales bacterium]|nr:ribonuclease H-like domain-containing protein [Thermomicrobiales bacterium]
MHDSARTQPHQLSAIDTERLLYGADPDPGIVAVELSGRDAVRVYRRTDAGVATEILPARPWLLAERAEPWRALRSRPDIELLAGGHPLHVLVTFPGWPEFHDAVRAAGDAGERFFRLRSPVEQFLVSSGKTLFKAMTLADVRRLQLDIETIGLDPRHPGSALLIVALSMSGGIEEVLVDERGEADLIEQLNERITALDPDVIEGHNLFNFDIPFLAERAARAGLELRWGRDGSTVRLDERPSRFKAGPLVLPYAAAYVEGRHVIDTYQQIQRYDTAGRLSSYGLKTVIDELGLTRPDRSFVPGDQIADLWRHDRDRLLRYALDDVRDVDMLARLTTPTEFYQTQLVPRGYQAVATGGPGEKINDLMLRAYLSSRQSVPQAESPRDYPGGHTELLRIGAFHPVVKCDVESLYPSIMLGEGITSRRDVLGAFLPMLSELTRRRLDAKELSREMGRDGLVEQQAMWEGIQGSFKVLINSFYGYLGYRGALFNDFDAATRVTLSGQRIIKDVVARLDATGALPIEVDTDGVYFVPPPGIADEVAEHAYIDDLSAALPAGIRLAHDGRYVGMLSLRLKTYALHGYDGSLILKGSALRSRRVEPCLRSFIQQAARHFLDDHPEAARTAYFALAERIRARVLAPEDIVQWGMVNEQTIAKFPRLRRLLERAGRAAQPGDRLEHYERQDGELALITDYQNDENSAYLLRRLHDVAARFRDLYADDAAFAAAFPPITPRTDMLAAQTQEPARQLGLF